MLDAAAKYMEQVEKLYPTRTYQTAVTDINGKTVFITKYFKPIAPPQQVLELPGDQQVCSFSIQLSHRHKDWVFVFQKFPLC